MVSSTSRLKWKTDFDKAVLIQNWEKRGWTKCSSDDDWNIFWANPWSVKQIFSHESGYRLREDQ